MDIDVSATLAALDALSVRFDAMMPDLVAELAHRMQASIMIEAPTGTPGNSTNAPGDLKRSVVVDGPSPVSEHVWEAQVGPTTVYARQREFGGLIVPVRARMLRFEKFGDVVFTKRVFQEPDPYTKRGYEAAQPGIEATVYELVTEVIEST